jgi:hypothetical protein
MLASKAPSAFRITGFVVFVHCEFKALDNTETDLEFRAMDKVRNSDSECYAPTSEPFIFYPISFSIESHIFKSRMLCFLVASSLFILQP